MKINNTGIFLAILAPVFNQLIRTSDWDQNLGVRLVFGLSKKTQRKTNPTSTPVVRTGVYPHMPIADHRETQIVYNTGRDRPCGRLFLTTHTVGQVCRTGLTTVERVIDFRFLTLEGLLLGQRLPKGEVSYYPPRSTIVQNFGPIAQTMFEIWATKVF